MRFCTKDKTAQKSLTTCSKRKNRKKQTKQKGKQSLNSEQVVRSVEIKEWRNNKGAQIKSKVMW
jgi:hypothetical protein